MKNTVIISLFCEIIRIRFINNHIRIIYAFMHGTYDPIGNNESLLTKQPFILQTLLKVK